MAWSRLIRVVLCPAASPLGSRKSAAVRAKIRKNRERIRVKSNYAGPGLDSPKYPPNRRSASQVVAPLTPLLAVGSAARPGKAIVNREPSSQVLKIRCRFKRSLLAALHQFARK